MSDPKQTVSLKVAETPTDSIVHHNIIAIELSPQFLKLLRDSLVRASQEGRLPGVFLDEQIVHITFELDIKANISSVSSLRLSSLPSVGREEVGGNPFNPMGSTSHIA